MHPIVFFLRVIVFVFVTIVVGSVLTAGYCLLVLLGRLEDREGRR
jgi:hypothetical protein